MSFSYASTNAASSGISWIRLRIADTSSVSARLSDEELQAFLDTFGNKYLAGAAAAESVAAQHAGRSDKTIGKLSISQGSISSHYYDLARTLRREASLFATPYAGGISADDKASEESDSDRVKPAFESGQFDYVADNSGASTAGS